MQYCGIAAAGVVVWLVHVVRSVAGGRPRSWAFWAWALGLPVAAVVALVLGQIVSPPPPAVIHLYTHRPSDAYFYNAAVALVGWVVLGVAEPILWLVAWAVRVGRSPAKEPGPTRREPGRF